MKKTTIETKQHMDFDLLVELVDSDDEPIDLVSARFVARDFASSDATLWIDEALVVGDNEGNLSVPAEEMTFYGVGYYELFAETTSGQKLVLFEGPFSVERSVREAV